MGEGIRERAISAKTKTVFDRSKNDATLEKMKKPPLLTYVEKLMTVKATKAPKATARQRNRQVRVK